MKVRGSTVFCDDIRREDNGKALLIGAYTTLVVQKLPTQLTLSAWIRLTGVDHGKHDITLKFEFPGGESFAVDGKAEVNDPTETDDITILGFPASLKEAGDITCNMIIAGETYELGRLTVQKAELGSASKNGS